jgi:porphobilinogen synthase
VKRSFPAARPRRLRASAGIRSLVREHRLDPSQFILPLFVRHGSNSRHEVASMPGVFQLSADDQLLGVVRDAATAGVGAVLLFGIPGTKDEAGSENWDDNGIVQQALRLLRSSFPGLLILTDVCCCEYTSHGHCGVLTNGSVDNDATLEVLGRVAVSHAQAGADLVAPSGMMDGMVGAIRSALDAAGEQDCGILSYAVKYASAFYGPFREAAGSAPSFGDRRQYQMDPANRREAMAVAQLDIAEGADMLMVKPALAYLDVLHALRGRTNLPLAAYSVSGEYAMIKAAARAGWIDERRVVLESLLGMRRAGADAIITYHAADAARWLAESP